MAGRGRMSGARLFQATALWAVLALLLALGTATTLADLLRLPVQEARRANHVEQRVIIDPVTGAVAGLHTDTPEKPFDVADTATAVSPTQTTPVAADTNLLPGLPVLRTQPLPGKIPAVERTNDSLVTAPAPEVTELVEGTALPKRGDKGVIAAHLYARNFTRTPKQILVSFVVLSAGLDAQELPLLLTLPKEVTIALSPYAHNPEAWAGPLRDAGHEVWSMLPSMGEHYPLDDPGPLGLIASMPKDELLRRLHTVMAAVPGSVGLVLPSDETLSTHAAIFDPLLTEITTRGLFLLEARTGRNLDQLSGDAAVRPMLQRADLQLDPAPDDAQITSKLAGLTAAAKAAGALVVVSSARPQTLTMLHHYFEKPYAPPLTLAPLSATYQSPAAPEKPDPKAAAKPAEAPAKTDAK